MPGRTFRINASDDNRVLQIEIGVIAHPDIALDHACRGTDNGGFALGGRSVAGVRVFEGVVENLYGIAVFGQVRKFVFVQVEALQ